MAMTAGQVAAQQQRRRDILCLGVGLTFTVQLPASGQALPDPIRDLLPHFLAWSRMATGFTEISEQTGRLHLSALLQKGVSAEMVQALDARHYGGTQAEKAALALWYTGVHARVNGPEVPDFVGALMWRAAGDYGAPTECKDTPESWASPPPTR
jgi:hypothetical protein